MTAQALDTGSAIGSVVVHGPAHRTNKAPLASALASGVATALIGIAGAGVGAAVLSGRWTVGPSSTVRLGWLLPLAGLRLTLTTWGALFLAIGGVVAIAAGVYTIGYARREPLPRFALAVLPLFVAAVLLVPVAGSATSFLFAWELMALSSLALVATEHHRAEVRSAAVYYAVLTQLGFAAVLLALLVLSASAHGDSFESLAAHVNQVSPGVRDAVFVLTLLGFGSKAGLLPLHAWLPRAHPEAPSPVSALMSAAMVNLGVYGIVRFDLQLLGPGPRWWGLTLMIVGGLSALYGVLHASVATDLKRLLAYSTTENMGLAVLALGAAVLLQASDLPAPAVVALTAALVQLIGHAAFKTLAFLAAGSVLAGTGLRDLDRLGGLARPMPVTTVLFGVAALGACGLPLGAGFVSEWLLLQALLHTPHHGQTLLALAMPLGVGVIALCTGLAVATMVKAFGIGFLARPRSPEAEQAREASPAMVAGMVVAAVGCVLVAVAPVLLGGALGRIQAGLRFGRGGHAELGARLRLPGVSGSIAPGWLALAVVVAIAAACALTWAGSRRRPRPTAAPLWACGAAGLTPRMQYTATSFAQPLQRVFDDVLRPDIDVQVTHYAESRYLVDAVAYRARLSDAIERRLYTPVVHGVQVIAAGVRRLHNGSVRAYLGYGALGLFAVVIAALVSR